MIKNEIEKFCLFLLIVIMTGVCPAFAQASGVNTLDLEQVSDDEFTEALNKAGDIELVNKEDNLTAGSVPAKSAITEETPAMQESIGKNGVNTGGKTGSNTVSNTGDEYLEESRRLIKLAEEAFSEADYDKSAMLADEAAFLAIDAASIAARPPEAQLPEAQLPATQLPEAQLSEAQLPEGSELTSIGKNPLPNALPATYTVRPWSVSKDCFWNIAGFPWVYGNPHQWRLLYNANKSKLPNPNNPNVIEPGTVLDIPSIKGELREGAWESGKTYKTN